MAPRPSLTRRHTLLLTAAAGAAALTPSSLFARPLGAVSLEELMKPGALPDLSIGSPAAKVTIVEYASMNCPHCAHFHMEVLPQLKAKYIDPGKVRMIFREYPLDNLAAGASMIARCAGDDKTLPMISVLFERQEFWLVRGPAAKVNLFEIAKQAGFNQDSFDKCLADTALLDKLIDERERAHTKFGVDSTPTFFINGTPLAHTSKSNEIDLVDFDNALAPLLPS